jgi:hypothetical protein
MAVRMSVREVEKVIEISYPHRTGCPVISLVVLNLSKVWEDTHVYNRAATRSIDNALQFLPRGHAPMPAEFLGLRISLIEADGHYLSFATVLVIPRRAQAAALPDQSGPRVDRLTSS